MLRYKPLNRHKRPWIKPHPSAKQMLACARVVLSEVLERECGQYDGDDSVTGLKLAIAALTKEIDGYFERRSRSWWYARSAVDKFRKRWEDPSVIAAYRWRWRVSHETRSAIWPEKNQYGLGFAYDPAFRPATETVPADPAISQNGGGPAQQAPIDEVP